MLARLLPTIASGSALSHLPTEDWRPDREELHVTLSSRRMQSLFSSPGAHPVIYFSSDH